MSVLTMEEMQRRIDNLEADNRELRQSVKASGVQQVLNELGKATAKFPTWPTDPLHALAVLGEEFGELTKAVLQHTYEPHKATSGDVRMEAIQTAAMALRFLMSLELYQYTHCEQHKQGEHHGGAV
jgi:hypothetical protein